MTDPYAPLLADPEAAPQSDSAPQPNEVEKLFGQKRRIVHTKLEVLASEIFERMRIRTVNLSGLERDKANVYEMLVRLDRQANYHSRDHQEKRVFYELLFKMKQEAREQDVECWRDIVMVMRDFLYAWEVREHMQTRAMFLDHAGP
jgi:hypothetical protein